MTAEVFNQMTTEQKLDWIKQGIEDGDPIAVQLYFLIRFGEPKTLC